MAKCLLGWAKEVSLILSSAKYATRAHCSVQLSYALIAEMIVSSMVFYSGRT